MTNWYAQEQAAFDDHARRIEQAEHQRVLRVAAPRQQRATWLIAVRARWRRWVQRRAMDQMGAR